MPLLTVRHVTTYRYRRPVAFGEHRMMFRPRDSHDQRLLESHLEITPEPSSLRWLHDVFGNSVAVAHFDCKADELRFESSIRVHHCTEDDLDFPIEEHARSFPFSYDALEMPDLIRSIERQYVDPDREVDGWVRRHVRKDRPTGTYELLAGITHAIRREFKYIRRTETGIQDPATTLAIGSGSCRDLALLMIEAVRSLGLAARFVSGYIYVPDRDEGRHLGGGSTHAWVQVYVPGAGWVEFDPTNGIVGNRDLIRVAIARDPRQAVPLSGSWYGAAEDSLGMTVEVSILSDERRGTGRPYAPLQQFSETLA